MDAEQRTKRDRERRQAINEAVRVADSVILEASDGSSAETDYLTGEVAEAFLFKVTSRLQSQVLEHDLREKS